MRHRTSYSITHPLFGLDYRISDTGELSLSGSTLLYSFKAHIVIPKDLYKYGVDFIREYAEKEATAAINKESESRKAAANLREALRSAINVEIGTKYDDTLLKGRVTYSKGKGLALLDVTLEQPEQYRTVETIYSSRHDGLRGLLEKDGTTVSAKALLEAKKLLIDMYILKRKQEKYALEYALYNELTKELQHYNAREILTRAFL